MSSQHTLEEFYNSSGGWKQGSKPFCEPKIRHRFRLSGLGTQSKSDDLS